jgi:hypothetical protein
LGVIAAVIFIGNCRLRGVVNVVENY